MTRRPASAPTVALMRLIAPPLKCETSLVLHATRRGRGEQGFALLVLTAQPPETTGRWINATSAVASTSKIRGRHPGRHRTRIPDMPGTPDPLNHAEVACRQGSRWAV